MDDHSHQNQHYTCPMHPELVKLRRVIVLNAE